MQATGRPGTILGLQFRPENWASQDDPDSGKKRAGGAGD